MSEKTHDVIMPEYYLLVIAVYGNMGDGELPELMKQWASSECRRLGLNNKLEELRAEKLKNIEKIIANIVGKHRTEEIAGFINKTIDELIT